MKASELIKALRETDRYIPDIFTNGGCYQFHLFLKKLYPQSEPYITLDEAHIITLIDDKYYDINGETSEQCRPMNELDISVAKEWSFAKMHCLHIGECPVCEEPIVV